MSRNENIIEKFGMRRTTAFTGKRKVGIDTNILIRIYEQPFLLEYEESRIFNYNDILFVHPITIFELTKFIIKKDLAKSKQIYR